jgi:hypothetical protein
LIIDQRFSLKNASINSHYYLQNMKNNAKFASSLGLILLAGCSGGGSSGGSSSASSTPPIPYFTDGTGAWVSPTNGSYTPNTLNIFN